MFFYFAEHMLFFSSVNNNEKKMTVKRIIDVTELDEIQALKL